MNMLIGNSASGNVSSYNQNRVVIKRVDKKLYYEGTAFLKYASAYRFRRGRAPSVSAIKLTRNALGSYYIVKGLGGGGG